MSRTFLEAYRAISGRLASLKGMSLLIEHDHFELGSAPKPPTSRSAVIRTDRARAASRRKAH